MQSTIHNPQSTMPNSPSAEPDRMQHNPTRYNGMQRKLVPAREATAFHWISLGMDCRRQLAADWTHRLEHGFPRTNADLAVSRTRQNATQSNRIQRDATKTRARAWQRHSTGFLSAWIAAASSQRIGRIAWNTDSPERTPTTPFPRSSNAPSSSPNHNGRHAAQLPNGSLPAIMNYQ